MLAKIPSLKVLIVTGLLLTVLAVILWGLSQESRPDITQLILSLVEKLTWQNDSDNKISQALTLFSILAIATSCALPRQIAALVAGINLGALWGAVIATLAATMGCLITFTVARFLLSEKIAAKYPKQLSKLSAFIDEQTFLKTIVIRLLPIGSNFLTNIVAGVSRVSMRSYVSGSLVGFIPQMVIFSLAGSGVRLGAKNEMIASAIFFIIALLLSGYLYKKHQQKDSKPVKTP